MNRAAPTRRGRVAAYVRPVADVETRNGASAPGQGLTVIGAAFLGVGAMVGAGIFALLGHAKMEGSASRDDVGTAAGRTDPPDHRRRHSRWIWVSALLAIAAVGLTIWALTLRSDVDSTQQELDQATQELATTKQEFDDAKQQLATAQQDVDRPRRRPSRTLQRQKQDAADAGTETDKAKAEAEQAKAESQAARSRAVAARGCAKAYIEAFGGLFEGDSPSAQAEAVRKALQSVTADCKDALAAA